MRSGGTKELRELHLFAGAGGGILGGMLLGHTCVCAVEINEYRRKILLQRQRDGILPRFPIWDDVRTFDGQPWRSRVDVLCSGFPCQKHSNIGKIHGSKGFDGWPDTVRVIGSCLPGIVFLENVPAILKGFWETVLKDLAILGYDAKWGVFSACSIGFPHSRERVFLLAKSSRIRQQEKKHGLEKCEKAWEPVMPSTANCTEGISRLPQPTIPERPDGLAQYMESIDAPGDGQVPAVVRLAWNTLAGE